MGETRNTNKFGQVNMRKRKMLYKLCKIGEKYLKWNT
jgi:hypothetical protein